MILNLYRLFFLYWVFPLARIFYKIQNPRFLSGPSTSVRPIWFHVASAGELESIVIILKELAVQRESIILTCFSRSGLKNVDRIAGELKTLGAEIVYFGYSPFEGGWGRSLRHFQPRLFVSVKYEAWPELWEELCFQGVPLLMLSLRLRASVKWAARFCRWFGAGIPKIWATVNHKTELDSLRTFLSDAKLRVIPDSRWDQVNIRVSSQSKRVQELLSQMGFLPSPWVCIGNSWSSDLEKILASISKKQVTLWIVPHEISGTDYNQQIGLLEKYGRKICLSTENVALSGVNTVVVNEFGILTELYREMDVIMVGGGFRSAGIHSPVEPSFFGAPLLCGPQGVSRFSESEELLKSGQMKTFFSEEQFESLLTEALNIDASQRKSWADACKSKLGGSKQTLAVIDEILSINL